MSDIEDHNQFREQEVTPDHGLVQGYLWLGRGAKKAVSRFVVS